MQQLAGMICNKAESYLGENSLYQTTATGRVASPLRCEAVVGTAYLELAPEPLHEQIKQFGLRAIASGCNQLKILPLFLLPGVHVMEDIPAEVALAQAALGENIKIELQVYLGTHSGLESLLAKQMAAINAEGWILLAHGSRRPGSKEPVEAMAANLGAVAAYWAVAPRLESRLKELVIGGYRKVGILPYFLFAGGITDAIAQTVEQFKLQFPTVNVQLTEPIGVSAALADLIWDLLEK
jgi:sirohydrochlorin ferrochelatase